MDFLLETARRIPPLIIMRNEQFIVCNSGCDARVWLTLENIRNSNAFVIFDPDGSFHKQYANTFYHDFIYNIKVLNLANIKLSSRYNPFAYVKSDKDVVKMANALIAGTEGTGKPGDINFLSAETMLLTALISIIQSEATDDERNINTIMEALRHMEIEKDDDGCRYKHAVDFLMEEQETKYPEHLSVQQYNLFDELTGDDPENVIDSCIKRLTPFDTDEMKDFFSNDELNLGSLNLSNTALFVIAGNTHEPLNPIATLMYLQLFDVLCEKSVQ